MKLTVDLELDNSAFDAGDYDNSRCSTETARILEQLASQIRNQGSVKAGDTFTVRDFNGNTVLQARIEK